MSTVSTYRLRCLLCRLQSYEPDIYDEIKSHFVFFKPNNRHELKEAVDCWCRDKVVATRKYGDISQWDVSEVTDMSCMFRYSQFDGDISQWDVSQVTRYRQFDEDISRWDVSKVTNMSCMFK